MRQLLALLAAGFALACGGGGTGTTPDLPNPGEPNDTILVATPIALGTPIVATSSSQTDFDFYAFTVPAGGATVRFQTFDASGAACDPVNELVDTFVEVYGASGARLAWSDDSWVLPSGARTFCEDFTLALPEGTGHVAVTGYPPYPFVYTLVVRVAP
jgi:hypothetical protein